MKKEKWDTKEKPLFSWKKSFIWSIPSIVLVIIFSLQAVFYVNEEYEQAEQSLMKNVSNVAEGYAVELENELNQLAAQAKPMAKLLGSEETLNKKTIANSLTSIKESTATYEVLYAYADGNAVTADGETVSIIEEEYYQEEIIEKPVFLYADKEQITGNPAIVVSVPIKNENGVCGSLLLFYQTTQFDTVFSSSEFSKMAFYALSDEQGNVFAIDGYPSKMADKGSNVFDKLQDATFADSSLEKIHTHFTHHASGYVLVSLNGEKKWIFYGPVEETNMMIFMGVDDSYLKKQLVKDMNRTYTFVGFQMIFIVVYILAMFVMFVVRRMKQAKNKTQKMFDGKTGLHTKEAAEKKISEYIEKEKESFAALFVIDIDNFTQINESQGKQFGDNVLKSLGKQLRNKFREYDIVSRYERDQFVVFLKYFPDEQLLLREADHVAKTFCNISFGEEHFKISTSIGCSIFPKDAGNVEELYTTATEALKVAKAMGKDQMVFYEEIKPEEAFAETDVEA